jgi:hypothetical protein
MMDCETQEERTAVADYISAMTAELAVMAAWAEHTDLARILEMARLESERLCGLTPNAAVTVAGDVDTAQDAADPFQSTNVILLSALRAARG